MTTFLRIVERELNCNYFIFIFNSHAKSLSPSAGAMKNPHRRIKSTKEQKWSVLARITDVKQVT